MVGELSSGTCQRCVESQEIITPANIPRYPQISPATVSPATSKLLVRIINGLWEEI